MVELRTKDNGQIKFLIDGFPRSEGNVTAWKEVVGDAAVLEYVLFFECPYDILTSRLLERGKTSGRSDDSLVSQDHCNVKSTCYFIVAVASINCMNVCLVLTPICLSFHEHYIGCHSKTIQHLP